MQRRINGGTMSQSAQRNPERRDEAIAWAHVCLTYHDLRLGANRHFLTGRWRKLRAASERGVDRIEDWLALQQEILVRDGDEDEYARVVPLDSAELDEAGGLDDEYDEADEPEYVCPTGRCALPNVRCSGSRPDASSAAGP
jgi:hypothetical protein